MIYDIYVGIDPSINSTGVTILTYCTQVFIEEKFYIIKPNKLTKREKAAEEKYANKFEYVLYEKQSPDKEENNTVLELAKTRNFMTICDKIKEIIKNHAEKYNSLVRIHVCQEGISYGSVTKTKSVFDLAGLNFMLRNMILRLNNSNFENCIELIIATPGEIKKFASGNGNCVKDLMVELFKASHKGFELPKLDDISDSYWMSQFAHKHSKI